MNSTSNPYSDGGKDALKPFGVSSNMIRDSKKREMDTLDSTYSIHSSAAKKKKELTNKDYFMRVQEQIFIRKFGQVRTAVYSRRDS
jgi:hypothetical protein